MSSHYIVTPTVYTRVLIVLFVLMAATIAAAKIDMFEYGRTWNLIIAITIAVTKMTFIATFFMQLKYINRLTWALVAVCVLFFFVMLGLPISDYMTRDWHSPFVEGQPFERSTLVQESTDS